MKMNDCFYYLSLFPLFDHAYLPVRKFFLATSLYMPLLLIIFTCAFNKPAPYLPNMFFPESLVKIKVNKTFPIGLGETCWLKSDTPKYITARKI